MIPITSYFRFLHRLQLLIFVLFVVIPFSETNAQSDQIRRTKLPSDSKPNYAIPPIVYKWVQRL